MLQTLNRRLASQTIGVYPKRFNAKARGKKSTLPDAVEYETPANIYHPYLLHLNNSKLLDPQNNGHLRLTERASVRMVFFLYASILGDI